MKKNNNSALLIHLSALTGYLFPFGFIITPFVLWLVQKDKNSFLDKHGKEAVNFNISFYLYIIILKTSIFSFLLGNISSLLNGDFNMNFIFNNYHNLSYPIGLFGAISVTGIIELIRIALIILASIKANEGEFYEYPFTLKLIK